MAYNDIYSLAPFYLSSLIFSHFFLISHHLLQLEPPAVLNFFQFL